MSRILAMTLALALTACGLKGPLELPPGPAPEPLLGKPKPATPPPAVKNKTDISTDQKPLAQ